MRYDTDEPLVWLECPACEGVTLHSVSTTIVLCMRCREHTNREDHSWLDGEHV